MSVWLCVCVCTQLGDKGVLSSPICYLYAEGRYWSSGVCTTPINMVCHNLRVNYPHRLLLVLAVGGMKRYVPTQEQRRPNKVMQFWKALNQRITEQLSLEVSFGGDLVQTPCSSRVTYNRLSRTLSIWECRASKAQSKRPVLPDVCTGTGPEQEQLTDTLWSLKGHASPALPFPLLVLCICLHHEPYPFQSQQHKHLKNLNPSFHLCTQQAHWKASRLANT